MTLLQAPSRAKQHLRAGDVLVSMTRPNLNAVALVPEHLDGAIGSTGFHVLRSRWLRPDFLFRLVQSQRFVDEMSALVQGALYPAVRSKDIAGFTFAFETVAQQNRIAAKVEELLCDLDAGVAELKAAQKKLAQHRQSLLKSALEGALTADWRKTNTPSETGSQLLERSLNQRRTRWEAKHLTKFSKHGKNPPKDWKKKYPEPVQPDTTALPELPEGWVWASLDMLGEITSGVAKGSKMAADVEVREVPYLRVANVQRGFLDLSEVKTILATAHDIAELTLKDGDVLFNEGGDRDKLGRGWVWRNEVADCIHQNHVFRMRPYVPEILPELISHHGNIFGKTWFQNAGKQTTNLASINMTILRMFPVPLGPADEQRELLTQLRLQIDQIFQQEQAVELSLKQSIAQRQNILRAAFAGELVLPDPSNESASVLLKRIRDERLQREKEPKARKTKQQKKIATVMSQLIDVLADAGDWVPAQEAFRRCGVSNGAQTERIEELYAELRKLDKAGRLMVEAVTDEQGHKLYDKLKLVAD
ncbi:restriction endonuclease [Delftia tsuruhatensis]|uniref:restriction endonuclease subunit S n=2 Tax=Delftia TaxID=80865 RepID=UPI000AC3C1AE|nr:restriction endonuclease [Delftia tsuruhatensis]MDH0423086.1 restriction endonuclease [Delftia tsuruhatensis]